MNSLPLFSYLQAITDRIDGRYRVWPASGQKVAMANPQALREKAEHYRRLAPFVNDEQALAALRELVAHYEALAAEMEATGGSPEKQG